MKPSLMLSLFLLLSASVLAQKGTVRGLIKDATTKEPLIGATVRIDGTTMGAATDLEGAFVVNNVPAGTHKVIITSVSYQTKEIPGVRVESGNTTTIDTELAEEGKALQEVVVRASRATNTEVAVITEIKQIKSIAVGISAQQIQRSQDRDAAAAIRRVPGVSIVDNRFVLIRGLGARYNSVLINDVIAPSTEVESRSFSFDLVPSNILDRMIVYKSGAAELPGDFAGGVIKIYTKRRPDQNFLDAGLTVGYRAATTLQSTQTHDRGPQSALGLWSADQQIPESFPRRSGDFNNLNAAQRGAFARLLPNTWALQNTTVTPDLRFALNMGRRFDWGNVRVSNITSLNYSQTHQITPIDFRLYQNGLTANDILERYNDESYQRQTRIGLLHNWTFRFSPSFILEWKTLYNLLGTTETVSRNGARVLDEIDVRSVSQQYENRSILTTQVSGEHTFSELSKFNWVAAFGHSGRWEPDWKRARFQRTTGGVGADGQPEPFQLVAPIDPNPIDVGRFYSRLNERVGSLIGNYERTLGNATDREPNKIKAGFYVDQRQRDYSARFYGYQALGNAQTVLRQDLGALFSPQNVTGQPGGLSLRDGTRDLDSYKGTNSYAAGYVSGDLYFGARTSLTLGFRGEYNNQTLTSVIVNEPVTLVNNSVFSPLPSLNLNYKLTEQQSIRLAYSSTLNRPELRELAPFNYFDFNLLADVRGNTSLKTATIQNADLKWEMYPSPNELFSVSGFYKQFRRPIETFLLPTGNGLGYTFVNAESARNFGVEVEFRKGFTNSASAFLQNIQLVGNASLINSRVTIGRNVSGPDLSGTIQNYDVSSIADAQRPLANQSPYLINAGIYYAHPSSGWQWNVLYNVAGPRIFAVGTIENPTVFEMPRHVVDLNVSRTFNKRLEIRAGVQDLLNATFRFVQDFNRDGRIGSDISSRSAEADQEVRTFRRGQYVTLTAVWTFGRRTIVP